MRAVGLILKLIHNIQIFFTFFTLLHTKMSLPNTDFENFVKYRVIYVQQLLWHCVLQQPLFPSFLVFRLLWFCWCSWCLSSLFLCLCPFLQAYPEFVLTYLEELNEREEVTQTENRIHHGAWSAAHQEIDSSSAEEVTVLSQRQVRDIPFKNTFWKEKYQCGSQLISLNK